MLRRSFFYQFNPDSEKRFRVEAIERASDGVTWYIQRADQSEYGDRPNRTGYAIVSTNNPDERTAATFAEAVALVEKEDAEGVPAYAPVVRSKWCGLVAVEDRIA